MGELRESKRVTSGGSRDRVFKTEIKGEKYLQFTIQDERKKLGRRGDDPDRL